MTSRRRYSDEDRSRAMAALAANSGHVPSTAAQLGIPVRTLRSWHLGERHPEAAHQCRSKMTELADALEKVAWKLLRALPGKIDAATLAATATAMGIAIDKMRLLRDQPTVIDETRHDDRLSEFRARYAALHAQGAAGTDGSSESLHSPSANGTAAPLPPAGMP